MKRSTEQSMAWPQLWRFACDKTHNCDLFFGHVFRVSWQLCIQPDPRQSQKAMKFRQEQRAEMELGVEAATRDQADHLGG